MADELVRAGQFGRFLDLLIGGLQPPVADVLADGAREQVRRLQHHADARLDGFQRQVGVVVPADHDAPALGLVKAAQQVDDGGLAAAGGTHQGDGLAGLDVQVEVLDDRHFILVPEMHMLKDDIAADGARVDGVGLVLDLGRGIDQGEDALGRSQRALHFGEHARQVLDGPHHEGHVGKKGLDAADADAFKIGLRAAVPDDAADGEGGDDLHDRQEERAQPGGAVAGLVHLAGLQLEFVQVAVLAPQRLDHAHAADVLVVRRGDVRVDLAHLAELLEDALAELHRRVQQHRDDRQHDQRQLPVDGEHEGQRGGDVDHAPGGVDQPPGDQLGHAFGVVGHAAHDPAHRGAAVIGKRKRLQVVEEHAAHVVAHALAHHARQVNEDEDAR